MQRLAQEWIFDEPPAETFDNIEPVPVLPVATQDDPKARDAYKVGEQLLRDGKVGLFLVAGGQGTRLGFDGPKGAYPIGPVSKKSLFAFHAEKILNLQEQYRCTLPWYIMVSKDNATDTEEFFQAHDFFGLNPSDVKFFTQRMVPCLDDQGKFMLESHDHLCMNPNGHGGSIPALVDNNILQDARARGIEMLSYFQVDNWGVKVADPFFLGYHALGDAAMSSKNHRKNGPREAVGVHCLCDGEYRVIEYSELDIYPQLLETDSDGNVIFYAGNPAIHILSVDFIDQVNANFAKFPWHRAHKKVAHLDLQGNNIEPDAPNAYKFETFVFDALRFCQHAPVALEIDRPGEFTPIKAPTGPDSVQTTHAMMATYWAKWLTAAGANVPHDDSGVPTIPIEISPQFARTKEEFINKTQAFQWPNADHIAIDKDGNFL
jgi:UDP-N-acetylglucosamine/UDP-N-acetylgalactosamine diphosphorylase